MLYCNENANILLETSSFFVFVFVMRMLAADSGLESLQKPYCYVYYRMKENAETTFTAPNFFNLFSACCSVFDLLVLYYESLKMGKNTRKYKAQKNTTR